MVRFSSTPKGGFAQSSTLPISSKGEGDIIFIETMFDVEKTFLLET